MELADELKMASDLSQLSSVSSIVPIQGSEAHATASSTLDENSMLELSSPENLDVLSIEAGEIEDSPPQSPAFEELLEVVTRAVAK